MIDQSRDSFSRKGRPGGGRNVTMSSSSPTGPGKESPIRSAMRATSRRIRG